MTAQQIETAVKENARANFKAYPECYPIENDSPTTETANALAELVKGYWENRSEFDEVEGVPFEDWADWVTEAFVTYLGEMEVEKCKTFS